MPQFAANVVDLETRLRTIEAYLSKLGDVAPTNPDQPSTVVIREGGSADRINLDGDVTGVTTETVVEALGGISVPAPVSGDDNKALTYDHANLAYDLTAFPAGVSGRCSLGAWAKNDVSVVTTVAPGEELFNSWSKGANDMLGRVLTGSGNLTAIGVTMDAAITGGGSCDFIAYLNGTATALTVTLSGSETKDYSTGSVAYVAGDLLTVYALRTGTISNTPKVVVVVEGNYS